MIDKEKANICTVMNTFGFDVVSGGPAIRSVVQFLDCSIVCRPTDTNRPHISRLCETGLHGFRPDVIMRAVER